MSATDYTDRMTVTDPPDYLSGDLRVCPARGIVANGAGVELRLGPVNMKVLVTLVSGAGTTISRAEIYTAVWGNQIVGEDALTRCISDIRGELRKLSGRDDWIETVPKRGYRWVEPATAEPAVGPARSAAPVPAEAAANVPAEPGEAARSTPAATFQRRLLGLAGRGALYLVVLILMGSAIVWVLDRFSSPPAPVVAALPVSAAENQLELAAQIDVEISAFLTGLDLVRVLSPSAIGARPSNPFPFFFYEFGARWLIEGELRAMAGHSMLTLTVADARTGIVEFQATGIIGDDDGLLAGAGQRTALTDLGRFLSESLRP